MNRSRSLVAAAAAALALLAAGAHADERNPVARAPVRAAQAEPERMIVRLRPKMAGALAQARAAQAADEGDDAVGALAARARFKLLRARRLGADFHLLELDPGAAGETFAAELARVRADAAVELAEPDRRRFVHALPNDAFYAGQWYLQKRADAPSAIDAESGWDVSSGTNGVVIAVIDTGVLYGHPDLKRALAGGRLLPGYDFIANRAAANDGDGRDADPSDPGDWVTQADADSQQFDGCDVTDSSWHGTRVAGILGAVTNNAEGIAGGTWSPWILPVRALGKCGGFDSDILAAMLWAGGIHVDGVPDNPYPAKIENLSFGSPSSCPSSYQSAIAELAARGVLVVVSAGNEGGPVDAPANCPGAVGVAGLRHAGTKVGFSSLGPEVALGAPGGNCVNLSGACLFPINTTSNAGATTPGSFTYTDQLTPSLGTSFSAPIVAVVAGLMASVNGNLGAAELKARLQEGTVPFPVSSDPTVSTCHVPSGRSDLQNTECTCTTQTCGAGMANVPRALAAAQRPIAALAVQGGIATGQTVTLSAAGSAAACGRSIASYAWAVTSGVGAVSSPNGATTTIVAPPQGSSVTVEVTVTDDAGREDTATIVIGPQSATTSAPANAGLDACLAAIPAPQPVTVSLAPGTASVAVNGSQAFTATVAHGQSGALTWQVNGVGGGNSTFGTISASGLYAAPAAVPTPATVTITAISNEDPNASASAAVTITADAAPASSGSSGGGGGAGLELALLLAALPALRGAALRRERRQLLVADPASRMRASRSLSSR